MHDEADEVALHALARSFGDGGEGRWQNLSATMLAAEMTAVLRTEQPDAVCLSSLGPGGRRQLRYLCKRVRQELPQMRIVVGNWGYRRHDADKMADSLKQCGADVVFTTLTAAREFFAALSPRSPLLQPAAEPSPTVRSEAIAPELVVSR